MTEQAPTPPLPPEIDVDTAFDIGKREWPAYIASRPYKDAEGHVHDPQTGQFINPDDYFDSQRGAARAEDEAKQEAYEDMSTAKLARKLAEAEVNRDRTTHEGITQVLDARFKQFHSTRDKGSTRNSIPHPDSGRNHNELRSEKMWKRVNTIKNNELQKLLASNPEPGVTPEPVPGEPEPQPGPNPNPDSGIYDYDKEQSYKPGSVEERILSSPYASVRIPRKNGMAAEGGWKLISKNEVSGEIALAKFNEEGKPIVRYIKGQQEIFEHNGPANETDPDKELTSQIPGWIPEEPEHGRESHPSAGASSELPDNEENRERIMAGGVPVKYEAYPNGSMQAGLEFTQEGSTIPWDKIGYNPVIINTYGEDDRGYATWNRYYAPLGMAGEIIDVSASFQAGEVVALPRDEKEDFYQPVVIGEQWTQGQREIGTIGSVEVNDRILWEDYPGYEARAIDPFHRLDEVLKTLLVREPLDDVSPKGLRDRTKRLFGRAYEMLRDFPIAVVSAAQAKKAEQLSGAEKNKRRKRAAAAVAGAVVLGGAAYLELKS